MSVCGNVGNSPSTFMNVYNSLYGLTMLIWCRLVPIPTYSLFKADKSLGRNDVIFQIARYTGKDIMKK